MLNKFSIFTSCLKIESTVCTVITPKMSNIWILLLLVLTITLLTMLLYVCIHIVTSTNTPTENDTIATVDEPQNSLHRTTNEDSGIIRTTTTIEL